MPRIFIVVATLFVSSIAAVAQTPDAYPEIHGFAPVKDGQTGSGVSVFCEMHGVAPVPGKDGTWSKVQIASPSILAFKALGIWRLDASQATIGNVYIVREGEIVSVLARGAPWFASDGLQFKASITPLRAAHRYSVEVDYSNMAGFLFDRNRVANWLDSCKFITIDGLPSFELIPWE